jgi:hypothetical protein
MAPIHSLMILILISLGFAAGAMAAARPITQQPSDQVGWPGGRLQQEAEQVMHSWYQWHVLRSHATDDN